MAPPVENKRLEWMMGDTTWIFFKMQQDAALENKCMGYKMHEFQQEISSIKLNRIATTIGMQQVLKRTGGGLVLYFRTWKHTCQFPPPGRARPEPLKVLLFVALKILNESKYKAHGA